MSNRTHPTVSAPPFTIEVADADDEAAFLEIAGLAEALQKQGGYAPPDYKKMADDIYATMKQGMTWLARAAPDAPNAGEALGALGLEEVAFRYSRETYLQDVGFYVKPQSRASQVGAALMAEACKEGERRGKIVLIEITSPDRRRKAFHTESGVVTQIAGFVPVGYVLRLGARAARKD
jgi:GNAT superfamily N-acetyltransferase